ncbi:FliG C-terminal domain-containing protein [uncultured Albimonas sp.]|uniref:flagellar motor switch protein FliG n=1 Tax=uncultured Albimonas sp. TaxID=1331701 RepID=UPI0030EE47D4|tara:strand:+ start:271 stop:1365 length:1095 start_codon:yes stop_codon:yes gene_type:complete
MSPPAEALVPAQSNLPAGGHPAGQAKAGPAPEALTPAQKAAIVIVALGPEAATEILRSLGETNIRRFATAVAKLKGVPHETVDAVVAEFLGAMGDELSVRGGLDEARKFLGQVLDEDQLARVMEEIDARSTRSIWLRLADASDAALANWLSAEHPQVACLVLAKLRADQAARLLERFEPAFAHDVVLRMARVPTPDNAALEMLKSAIEHDFVSAIERTQGAAKPAELIASLMNHVSNAARETFLSQMEQDDPKLAQEVQRVMFTFADIASRVNPRDISKVIRGVDEPVLMAALKLAQTQENPSAEFILGNVAKRLSDRMREDLAGMPDVRQKEGEAAQAELVNGIQTLARRGEIKLIEIDLADD